jgi:hypothetical protein
MIIAETPRLFIAENAENVVSALSASSAAKKQALRLSVSLR